MPPIKVFISVVFPTPFRPMIARISPLSTPKETPFTMRTRPYPEVALTILSSMVRCLYELDRSRVLQGTEIYSPNVLICFDCREGVLREQSPEMKHAGHRVEVADEFHVVLDNYDSDAMVS